MANPSFRTQPVSFAWVRPLTLLLWICLFTLGGESSVYADTTVSGDTADASDPLVIDPSASPASPRTFERNLGGAKIGFIQAMPATKRVTAVTLGDIARGAGCGQGSARLFIDEQDAEGGQPNQILSDAPSATLPAAPGKVTWTIPSTTFRKGYGYRFYLGLDGGCTRLQQTTWPHNSGEVNGGVATCAPGPPAEPDGDAVLGRMWHSMGSADSNPSCSASDPNSFSPDMPEGWLVTAASSGGGYVLAGEAFSQKPTAANMCGIDAANMGAVVVEWRDTPGRPPYKDYVCKWPQYRPPHDPSADGWYFGMPWPRDGSGAPRDVYIRLDSSVSYDDVLDQFKPVIKYDGLEQFQVISAGALTDFFADTGFASDSNQLKDSSGGFALANPDPFLIGRPDNAGHLSLDLLGSFYPSTEPMRRAGDQAQPADYISARGDADSGEYVPDNATMASRVGYGNHVYGRAALGDDGELWLQYWFFYYDNPVTGDQHEGDWEMVQVGLNSSNQADKAAYAQHDGGQLCQMSSVETSGGHPLVYVARNSHASYFGSDRIPVSRTYDTADGLGPTSTDPESSDITSDTPLWIRWPGKWGDSVDTASPLGGGSPTGPKFQPGDKWSDPSAWARGLDGCT